MNPPSKVPTSSKVRRIAAGTVCTFPGWFLTRGPVKTWIRFVNDKRPFLLDNFGHYHPDQPTAPTEVPDISFSSNPHDHGMVQTGEVPGMPGMGTWVTPPSSEAGGAKSAEWHTLIAAAKWIERIHDRMDMLPKSFLDNADPLPIAVNLRAMAAGRPHGTASLPSIPPMEEVKAMFANTPIVTPDQERQLASAVQQVLPATPTTDEAIAREAAEEIMRLNYPKTPAIDNLTAIILRALSRARQGTEKDGEAVSLLEQMLFAAENADETGYVTDVGFIKDFDALNDRVRAYIAARHTKEGGV